MTSTRHAIRTASVALLLVITAACSSKRVLVAPAVSLVPHSRIGLVTFTAQNAKGALPSFATQRFMQQLLRSQPGIEILELGPITTPIDAAAAKRLGEEHGVRSIIVGHLVVSDVRPRVSLAGGFSASAEATVSLSARLLNTSSGSTLWSQSSRLRETIAAVSLLSGQAVFDAKNPDEAYGEMVDRLVWNLTQDFRGTYRKM